MLWMKDPHRPKCNIKWHNIFAKERIEWTLHGTGAWMQTLLALRCTNILCISSQPVTGRWKFLFARGRDSKCMAIHGVGGSRSFSGEEGLTECVVWSVFYETTANWGYIQNILGMETWGWEEVLCNGSSSHSDCVGERLPQSFEWLAGLKRNTTLTKTQDQVPVDHSHSNNIWMRDNSTQSVLPKLHEWSAKY